MQFPLNQRKLHKYYLNDYPTQANRLRIESMAGGLRTIWAERTSMNKMKQTKAYLEKCWGV